MIVPWIITPLTLVASAIVGVVTLVVARTSVDRMFAATVLGALLISPLGWIYYLWLAAPGVIALWHTRRLPPILWIALVILLVPFYGPPHSAGFGPLATFTLGSAYFWAVLLIWGAVVSDALGDRTTAPRTSDDLQFEVPQVQGR
jgi:hypothetical protein